MRALLIALLSIPALAQVAPIFPTRAAGNADMFILNNTCGGLGGTRLATQIGPSDMQVQVVSAVGCTAPLLISVEREIISIASISGVFMTVASSGRGFDGTTAAGHIRGQVVLSGSYAMHHNREIAEIESLESFVLGIFPGGVAPGNGCAQWNSGILTSTLVPCGSGGGGGGGTPASPLNSVQTNSLGSFGSVANTTTAKLFLTQTGTGTAANAPLFGVIQTADLPVIPVILGGTSLTTLGAHGVLLGNGTAAINIALPGTAGFCLLSNGNSADPGFQACPPQSFSVITGGINTNALTIGTGGVFTVSGTGQNHATDLLSGGTISGLAVVTNIAPPATPAGGLLNVYGDVTGKVLSAKNDLGQISHTFRDIDCSAGGGLVQKLNSDGSETCGTPGGTNSGGGGGQSQSFTSATSVVIPGLGTQNVTLACYDTLNNAVSPAGWSISGSAPYNVTATFGTSSGRCVITGMGKYVSTLQSGATWTVTGATSGFATPGLNIQLYDNSSPRRRIEADSVTVDTSTFNVVVAFANPQTGFVVIE